MTTSAQNYTRVFFDESAQDGYYLAVRPATQEIQGVLVLMPGFSQIAEQVFPETKLHNVAFLRGILTVTIAGGRKLYADEDVVSRLNTALQHVQERYGVDKDRFVIGGFSAGGTISLRYAEYCAQYPAQAAIQPRGVFSVDSPIDLFKIWEYFDRELERNYSEAGVNEANFVKDIMLREIGDPIDQKANYAQLTPFDSALGQPGNEQYLAEIAVRTYHDIDVEWLIQNRRRSLYDSNALAASELISRLVLQGHERAEFIQAKQPGERSNGQRHPHSWSIVDEVDCVNWVEALLSE